MEGLQDFFYTQEIEPSRSSLSYEPLETVNGSAETLKTTTKEEDVIYRNASSATTTVSSIEIINAEEDRVLTTYITASPTGHSVAVASENGSIFIFDYFNAVVQLKKHTDIFEINYLSFSPEAKWLAIASTRGRSAALMDLSNEVGEVTYLVQCDEDASSCIAWSTNGAYVATGSGAKTAVVWDINRLGIAVSAFVHASDVLSIAFTSDATRLLTTTNIHICLWDIETGCLLAQPYSAAFSLVRVSPSSNAPFALVSEDDGVALMDLNNGQLVLRYEDHANDLDFTSGISFSPFGNQVLYVNGDRLAAFYLPQSFANGAYVNNPPQRRMVEIPRLWTATFSNGGRYIASGNREGLLQLWDADTLELLVTIDSQYACLTHLMFSENDDYLIAHRNDGTCRVWNIAMVKERLFGAMK